MKVTLVTEIVDSVNEMANYGHLLTQMVPKHNWVIDSETENGNIVP